MNTWFGRRMQPRRLPRGAAGCQRRSRRASSLVPMPTSASDAREPPSRAVAAHAPRHEGHGHGVARDNAPRHALLIALLLTSSFIVVEIVVGVWSGSLALLADAGHMVGDAGALGLSLAVAIVAMRPRSPTKTYGYRRAEVIGALVNATTLCMMAVWIVVEAFRRLQELPAVMGEGMLIAATIGLGVNIAAAWVLSSRGGGGINVRAALLHVLGDALGSLAAIVAGVLVVWLGWRAADPVASLVIALLLFVGAVRLLRETVHLLMEGTPDHLDAIALEETIRQTPGVQSVHDFHVWALTPEEPMLTAHVVLEASAHGTDVVHLVTRRLHDEHGVTHATIQPEAPGPGLVPLRLSGNDADGRNNPGPT